MSTLVALSVILFQAVPPPIVLRDHAPAPAYDSGFVAYCANFRASLTRRDAPAASSLDIEIGGQAVAGDDIDRITNTTPIMKAEVAPTILCGQDSILVSFRDGFDDYDVLIVGHRLEAITRNNRLL